jgi:hypothetical protein
MENALNFARTPRNKFGTFFKIDIHSDAFSIETAP